MLRTIKTLLASTIILTSYQLLAVTEKQEPRSYNVPGGIAILKLEQYSSGTSVEYDGKRASVLFFDEGWYALGGIPLTAKAGQQKQFTVKTPDGKLEKSHIVIAEKKFPEQHLTISNKRKVNPSAEDMVRISKERILKSRAKSHWSENPPEFYFTWPVDGRISSTFGLRRFFNKQERRPHSGLDIAAPEGTPVRSTADGTVIETGDFFFSGNMIYIDHGQGIISLYAHLSEIDVKKGDVIKQGDIIGKVGQTGRVTGPHLHFAILANRILVDPLYLLNTDEERSSS